MAKRDYAEHYRGIDFRARPDLYRIGKGEQGVLIAEPYKSEILPHWRFRTPDLARESADIIYTKFERYLAEGDFVGADMARKFLQMGWTRARRYANHTGGRKFDPDTGAELPRTNDPVKAESAAIFYDRYIQAREHPNYVALKQGHEQRVSSNTR
jgi:hypothetical protein